ncbi:MAG: FMN-binding protein [Candidatus Levyibacteriota bacterium]
MRKYLQITVVLGGFFLLAFIKSFIKSDEGNASIGGGNAITPLPTVGQDTPTATDTPTPAASGSTLTPTATPVPATPTPKAKGVYKDGTYNGSVEDAFYGNVQVQAIISGGRLSDIQFLQYPNDNSTSLSINSQALPMLKSEAISAQSANIDMISGASDSSPAFARSLGNALSQAKN